MSINHDLIEDWKFNIERANEIVRLYGTQTRYFMNLTLSLITTYNILYAIFNFLLSSLGFFVLTISFILYMISAIYNLYLSLKKNSTAKRFKIEKYPICFYKSIFNGDEKEISKDLNSEDFKSDYHLQLNTLLKYQKNYYEITYRARKFLMLSVIIFSFGLTISILISFLPDIMGFFTP